MDADGRAMQSKGRAIGAVKFHSDLELTRCRRGQGGWQGIGEPEGLFRGGFYWCFSLKLTQRVLILIKSAGEVNTCKYLPI